MTAPEVSTPHPTLSCPAQRARRVRRTAAAALLIGAVPLLGAGAFSSWNVTTNAASGTLSAASGGVSLLDANGGQFTTGVANLLPGDFFYRYVDIRNDGNTANTFTGNVSATGELAGQVGVEATSCSVAWTTVAGVSTCSATASALGAGSPTASTPITFNHGTIAAGSGHEQHVRYKFTFATTAPENLQGKTGSVSIGVSNVLVGGTDRTDG